MRYVAVFWCDGVAIDDSGDYVRNGGYTAHSLFVTELHATAAFAGIPKGRAEVRGCVVKKARYSESMRRMLQPPVAETDGARVSKGKCALQTSTTQDKDDVCMYKTAKSARCKRPRNGELF
eukprot:2891730-Lingulodinium_polyedra.AAC.1